MAAEGVRLRRRAVPAHALPADVHPVLGRVLAAREVRDARGMDLSLRHLLAPGVLIATVLGCIIGGVTSPSEASAIGAAGSLLIAAVHGRVNWDMLRYVMLTTTKLMGMLMWITIAAVFFSKIYVGLGAGMIVGELIEDFALSPILVIVAMLVTYFVLGMFIDFFEIAFIVVGMRTVPPRSAIASAKTRLAGLA